jgi:hypothetical protein
MRLGTGHALVALHESRAPVLGQMAPSPFELIRQDNTGSQAPRERAGGRAVPAPARAFDPAPEAVEGEDIPF